MAAGDKLGKINCHLCGWPNVVKESKGGKANHTCDNCGVQVFARGPDSDARIRAAMTPFALPPTNPKPEEGKPPKAETAAADQEGGDNGWDI